jgi:hypothetical protein
MKALSEGALKITKRTSAESEGRSPSEKAVTCFNLSRIYNTGNHRARNASGPMSLRLTRKRMKNCSPRMVTLQILHLIFQAD